MSVESTQTLTRSWLVQRLGRPQSASALSAVDEAFAFGGGLRNGGLASRAMDFLRPIFSFEYMGSAEFEWGAVPEALTRMAHSDLTTGILQIPLAAVAPNWRVRTAPAPDGSAPVYYLCHQDVAGEVVDRISQWAAGNERLKEPTRLSAALRPYEDWDTKTRGWLELDNGFFFFIDETMWDRTCSLFEVVPNRVTR